MSSSSVNYYNRWWSAYRIAELVYESLISKSISSSSYLSFNIITSIIQHHQNHHHSTSTSSSTAGSSLITYEPVIPSYSPWSHLSIDHRSREHRSPYSRDDDDDDDDSDDDEDYDEDDGHDGDDDNNDDDDDRWWLWWW